MSGASSTAPIHGGRIKPYIGLAKADKGYHAFFGIELKGCVAERGESREEKEITQRALRRQVDFISSLFSSDASHTFAIRYFSRPRASQISAGKIDVTLLGRITEQGKTTAAQSAADLCRETAALLAASMPNHLWQIISDSSLFEQRWQPFPLLRASVCEIRRREEAVSLVTMRSKGPLGFGATQEVQKSQSSDSVYFIHHFPPRPSTFARLLRMLLLYRRAVLLQVSLKPTRLTGTEITALEDQITQCEQSWSDILGRHSPGDDPIVHKSRAGLLYETLLEQALRLHDAPYSLQINLASPQRLPRTLAEAVGVEMIRPIGDHFASEDVKPETFAPRELQAGGYDTVFPDTPQSVACARENLRTLDFMPWGASSAPKQLGRLRHLVDSGEAAAAFRFPLATSGGLDGIEVHASRFRPQPLELAQINSRPQKQRLLLGENISLGMRQTVSIAERDRRQHTYVVGQTGTGKTSLLRTMILSDMDAGKGVAVLDPHGDLFRELLLRVPKRRQKDVIVFDPTDRESAVGLNLLQCQNEDERHFVVREMRAIMERLLDDQYHHKAAEYTGPIFYQHMQMNMLLAMSDPKEPGTLLEFYEIYQQKNYWKRWLPLKWDDAQLLRWVRNNLPSIDYLRRSGSSEVTLGEYLSSKFDDFVFDPRLRMIFGQKHSTIDLRKIMDEGKILLVNLAKGELSEPNSRFLGMALMAKIQAAAMSRSDMPLAKRRTFYVYVDEFQSLATENFISLLSEGRKFGLALVLANQFLSQIKDERIMQSVTGNVGTHVCFRVGREDAKLIEPQFAPYFDQFDLCNLPNWNACVRTTVDGQVVSPFTMETVVPPASEDLSGHEIVMGNSRQRYSRPRQEIETQIRTSIARSTLSVDEIMEEVEKRRLTVVLVEGDPSIIDRFRRMIRGFPIALARDPYSVRPALFHDCPAILFCNIDPPKPKPEKPNDTQSDPSAQLRRLFEQTEDPITLADYMEVANAQPWSPFFLIPYRTSAIKTSAATKISPLPNVFVHPELTLDQLEDHAVQMKKFNPWLRQLLANCEASQNPSPPQLLRAKSKHAKKYVVKVEKQNIANNSRPSPLPDKGNLGRGSKKNTAALQHR